MKADCKHNSAEAGIHKGSGSHTLRHIQSASKSVHSAVPAGEETQEYKYCLLVWTSVIQFDL